MKLSPARLLITVAILLAAGVGTAGYLLIGDDGDDSEESADDGPEVTTETTTTLATTTTSSDLTTTTLAATTTTTAATTTTSRPTTTSSSTTSTAPGATTTTTAARGTCGSGTARVTFVARDLVTTPERTTFVPQATVENAITKPIEVETLVADVSFADGTTRTVTFNTAGVVIAPGTTHAYTAEQITSPANYSSARIPRFAYFTQGLRDRCRVSTG